MRSVLLIALVLAGCGKTSSKKEPPASKPVVASAQPVTAPIAQPPAPTGRAAWGAKGCPDGWTAKKTEWMGMGAMTVTVTCKEGVPTLIVDDKEPRGETTTSSQAISRDVWEALWKQLEVASWRDLASGCPELAVPSPIAMGITDLELEITDGKATKKLECRAMNLTSQHDVIMKAFDKAAGIADDEPST